MKKYYIAAAVSGAIALTCLGLSAAKGQNTQGQNSITDFGRIQNSIHDLPIIQYDPNEPHYWRLAIQDGNIKIEDDYQDAEECYLSTFTEEEPDGPWRTCIALDEPSEGFLALYISTRIGRQRAGG